MVIWINKSISMITLYMCMHSLFDKNYFSSISFSLPLCSEAMEEVRVCGTRHLMILLRVHDR